MPDSYWVRESSRLTLPSSRACTIRSSSVSDCSKVNLPAGSIIDNSFGRSPGEPGLRLAIAVFHVLARRERLDVFGCFLDAAENLAVRHDGFQQVAEAHLVHTADQGRIGSHAG